MEKYIEQHKRRLNYMPWLYFSLKEKHLQWAKPWQDDIQKELMELETVKIGKNCFISSLANIFAEPGRDIIIGNNVSIGAETFLHGPIIIEDGVSINAGVFIDGGAKGVLIKKNTRIANGTKIYAFNHGISLDKTIKEQSVTSKGITIGSDVWIGANVCVVDGVTIDNQAIVGMGSVVTKSIPNGEIFAGNPAKKIGHRS